MWTCRRFLPLLLLALLAAGPDGAASAPPGLASITVDGVARSYAVETVGGDGARGLLPIIVFLHGAETDIRLPIPPRFDVPFGGLPGMESALVVRPQGFGRRWAVSGERFETPRRLWREVTGRVAKPPDEIAFIDAVVARLIARAHGDPARVYVVGVSSGGAMALRLACAPHQPFAAYAAILATAEAPAMPTCMALPPVSLLLMASTTDPTVPYAGRREGRVARISAPETAAAFASRAGCTDRTETPLPHRDDSLPSTITRVTFGGCAKGTEVVFYRVDGSGHSVPSLRPLESGGWAENGARNRDVETAALVWDFFRTRRGPVAP